MIQQFLAESFTQEKPVWQNIDLVAAKSVVTSELIGQVLQECGVRAQRVRKLPLETIVWLLIGMGLFSQYNIEQVFAKLTQALRQRGEDAPALPQDSALTYRRHQLGVAPLVALFHRVCRPLATRQTPGAFYQDLRLVALDGHSVNLPDTPENAAYFGRPNSQHSCGAFPQALLVGLSEIGTRAFLDAGIWPCHTGEYIGARRVLRSVQPGMLVSWDRGFTALDLFTRVLAQGGHVLARLPASVKPERLQLLPDSTWLVRYGQNTRDKQAQPVTLRLIRYTLCVPGATQEVYQVVTSLLDWERYPAVELAALYHERWEIENGFDEIETHQQRPDTLLRSRKPLLVLQEVYALLIAHYLVRYFMWCAAQSQGLDPDRVSFTHTLRLVAETTLLFALTARDAWQRQWERFLAEIGSRLLPARRGRSNPRVVKRKSSKFAKKQPEDWRPLKHDKPFHQSVALLI